MFKKSAVVGVSVSPERGLEIAQIDYSSGTVLKYGRKSIDYNVAKREIADLDLFKETLQDLLEELAIPKGTSLVINMPTVAFRMADYPSALEMAQIEGAVEDELYDNPYLKNYEPCFDCVVVGSSLQSKKIAFSALNKSTMIEMIMAIREIGYKVTAIDTSACSVLNALIYLDRVKTDPDTNWMLLTIDNSTCRIMSMMGKNYIDVLEEKISIGEVLSDAENYSTVLSTIDPLLKNLPSKYLCIVSKTNVISAEVIANKISYPGQVIYQEANSFLKEPLLNISSLVDEEFANTISLDVIGAAIYQDFAKTKQVNMNLYNKTLGEIYFMEQPPSIMGGKVVLSNSLLIFIGAIIAGIVGIILAVFIGWISYENAQMNAEIQTMEDEIAAINQYIEKHKDISSEKFDEGDEIRLGLSHNKSVYSYYTIVGTEIPQKLWLTHLKLGDKTTIEGQADNLESVYSFFRSIKDYNPKSDITLQKLGLAVSGPKEIDEDADKDTLLTTLDADFYEFRISNEKEAVQDKKNSKKSKSKKSSQNLPELEVIN